MWTRSPARLCSRSSNSASRSFRRSPGAVLRRDGCARSRRVPPETRQAGRPGRQATTRPAPGGRRQLRGPRRRGPPRPAGTAPWREEQADRHAPVRRLVQSRAHHTSARAQARPMRTVQPQERFRRRPGPGREPGSARPQPAQVSRDRVCRMGLSSPCPLNTQAGPGFFPAPAFPIRRAAAGDEPKMSPFAARAGQRRFDTIACDFYREANTHSLRARRAHARGQAREGSETGFHPT